MPGFLRTTLAVAVLALSSNVWAADGLLITETTTTDGNAVEHQIQLEAHRMRMESAGATGPQVVIFDGAAEVVRIVNEANKTYTEITKADLDRLSAQMTQMMAMMQDQLKNMPPEQRAQVEAMMRGRGAGAALAQASKTEYRRAGTDRVGAWTCTKYEGFQDGKKVSELCTVSPDTLGFTQADFQVTREMAAFFQALVPPGMNQQELFAVGDETTLGFSGVPVRRSSAGTLAVTTVIESVTRQSFPASTFEVPDGYRKQALPAMGK